MTENAIDILMTEIQSRVQAISENTSEARIKVLIEECLGEILADPETPTKMRFFGKSSESKLLGSKFSRWGLDLGDIEFLHDIQSALRRHNPTIYTGPSESLTNAFKAISDARYISQEQIREIDQKALDNLFPRIPKHNFFGRDRELVEKGAWEETSAYQRAMETMNTTESGYGSQLVGAQYVGEIWQAARAKSKIFALLRAFEMTAPTAYLPVMADIPEMFYVPERADITDYPSSRTGSRRVQVDAKKFVIHQIWTDEMQEDAILPYIPLLRGQALLSMAHYSDSLVLNGDTTIAATGNINSNGVSPSGYKHYIAFDGLRHVGLVDNIGNSKDLNGPITWKAMVGALGRMISTAHLIDWGHPIDPADVISICDTATGDAIGQLAEVVAWKIQQGRPLLPGQVAEVLGHPVISSIAAPRTAADGRVSTTVANDKGQLTTFNRNGAVVGWRRRVQTEVERLPGSGHTRIVHSLRLGGGRHTSTGAATDIEMADTIYNITES